MMALSMEISTVLDDGVGGCSARHQMIKKIVVGIVCTAVMVGAGS